jgi:enediyne biosynthesis protein E3
MNSLLGSFRRRLFGLSVQETSFDRRGFRGGANGMREQLERVGTAFLAGYHAALAGDEPVALAAKLDETELEWRGFAFEGAAMGLALRDWLTPWNRGRVAALLRGAGHAHAYMIHVGAGWIWARVPMNVPRAMERMDPLLRWLALDGYGFHEAFFKWPAYLAGKPRPRRLAGYQRRAFDQGFGRCLWFVDGGDVERIPRTIASLPPARHADLWGGVGLAATYAGGASEEALRQLRASAGRFQPQLAQGSAFAAKARLRAGNATPDTDLATQTLCDLSAEDAARVTDAALENLPADGCEPAFETWRARIQQRFAAPQLAHVP